MSPAMHNAAFQKNGLDYIYIPFHVRAEELGKAAETYPTRWIEEAFEIAVEQDVRRWRYVRGILDRWMREGKDGRRA